MSSDCLERPVWSALTTRHAEFAVGATCGMGRAWRYAADVSPFAAAADDDPDSLRALTELIPSGGSVALMHVGAVLTPPGAVIERAAPGVQMVAEALTAPGEAEGLHRLTEADAPEMLALAKLTEPGPFLPRTHRLGTFWGVKENGRLVAMAGERMRPPGYTELSGVCTHPDARGRGHARRLSAWVARKIADRGEIPILHAYAANTNAIRLYESLGFILRRPVTLVMLGRG